MKIWILLLFSLSSTFCGGQSIDSFDFVLESGIEYDSVIRPYLEESNFSYRRVNLSDSSFREQGLFNFSDSSSRFKRKGLVWYIYRKGGWELFYNGSDTVRPIVPVYGPRSRLVPLYRDSIGSVECLVYERVNLYEYPSGGRKLYWFNPQYGFIRIQYRYINYIRSDFNK